MKIREFLESTGGHLLVLFVCMVLFSVGFILAGLLAPEKEGMFQALYGLASQFAGALLLLIKQRTSPSVDATGRNVEVNVSDKAAEK